MQLYFSGLNSLRDVALLRKAGITHALVDVYDLKYVAEWPGRIALDSGAYRVFKGKAERMSLEDYAAIANAREFDFVVQQDVIGNEDQTRENYFAARHVLTANPLMPVWGWGATKSWLNWCLDHAPVVGVGGLVPHMRSKIGGDKKTIDQLKDRVEMLTELLALCRRYPGRLHLFGINWLAAFCQAWPYAASGDTSKWLDARRYGHLIFYNTRLLALAQAPASSLPEGIAIAGREPAATFERLTRSAQALARYRS